MATNRRVLRETFQKERPKAILKKERGVWVYEGQPTKASIPDLINREREKRQRELIGMSSYFKIAVSAILTILLKPLWTWIEATYGIESIGHSGPADWCFEAVYAIVGGLAGIVLWFGYWHRRI